MGVKLLRLRRRPPDPISPASTAHPHPPTINTTRISSWRNAKAATLIGLAALKESADAFPPLKSAVAGVLCIVELADAAKANKKESRQLALRAKNILDAIADAVQDPHCLDPDLQCRIHRFTSLLDELITHMRDCSTQTLPCRLLHHRSDKESIDSFSRRLDEEFLFFTLMSQIKLERMGSHIVKGQADLSLQVQEVLCAQRLGDAAIKNIFMMSILF
ncbi:hypothetical protein HWV62_20414 [Athelia sp. TMB]|nr:hypothetical protein HWV62_20414 [Athelia sp. TMB]